MRTKIIARFSMSSLCIALSSLALAQSAPQPAGGNEALYARSLAASCANCHGTDGKVVAGSTVPSLAGMDKTYFVEQMKAFKVGTRSATLMHQISKGFNDAQIESMANYFAAQKK
jgi:cytochrome subunit of sulfide dehydrogenase